MYAVIVGATGLAGQELVKLILDRRFIDPHTEGFMLYASDRSVGTCIAHAGVSFLTAPMVNDMFVGVDVAFFAVDSKVARALAPKALGAGAIVIDKSSAFRMDEDVPLVIPEINPQALEGHKGLIASPNCSTTIMLMGLFPLHRQFGLKRVTVSTYQSISGGGNGLVASYNAEIISIFGPFSNIPDPGELPDVPHFNNVVPHIDSFDEDGFTGEETKMVAESRKILGMPNLPIVATCVRVPVTRGHSMSVNAEFESPVDVESARQAILRFSHETGGAVGLVDGHVAGAYPMPSQIAHKNHCEVGRIRKDPTCKNGLVLFISGDNLWKGAALNALQIAEHIT